MPGFSSQYFFKESWCHVVLKGKCLHVDCELCSKVMFGINMMHIWSNRVIISSLFRSCGPFEFQIT